VLPTFLSGLVATVNVLIAASETGFQRLVLTGSSGEPEPGEIPCSPYAAAKAGSRLYARLFHQLYQSPVVLTRIFMTYGPGQSPQKIIPHCIDSFSRRIPVKLSWPHLPVDWIYVEDVVEGLLTVAVTPGLEGHSVDLGSGETVKIYEVADRIRKLMDSNTPIECGGGVDRRYEPCRCADAARTQAATGWRHAISLDAGLEKTIRFYKPDLRLSADLNRV
jgi:nucleoside-diphosphate-sugar epimerase